MPRRSLPVDANESGLARPRTSHQLARGRSVLFVDQRCLEAQTTTATTTPEFCALEDLPFIAQPNNALRYHYLRRACAPHELNFRGAPRDIREVPRGFQSLAGTSRSKGPTELPTSRAQEPCNPFCRQAPRPKPCAGHVITLQASCRLPLLVTQ